ncbi:hypothetical protein [Aquincola sp. J276]|uniref:hypothetical protein n=1 Tax=Aquincola sp. J276 TaxID=2898432 RepID=UPI002151C47E|nr:hypothetical protein [Aquincola sp. J276]MCR5867811.1 hypothetical protein [Aquincola sp. J276]
MSRLHDEFRRLFQPAAPVAEARPPGSPVDTSALADDQGRVRALVLELARPADWPALAAVWQGVQAELGLPAPAVAVNGSEGLQLWFSLVQPVPVEQAQAFLQGLRRRWLSEVAAPRLALLPRASDAAAGAAPHWGNAAAVLSQQAQSPGCWPAFIAPDLAAVFADTPWLDLQPSAEGQADLLAGLRSLPPQAWQAALQTLAPPAGSPAPANRDLPASASAPALAPAACGDGAPAAAERFLRSVMDDGAAPLALRIEAAKALLGAGRAA